MVEHTTRDGDEVRIVRAGAAGQHVIHPGEDVPAGERLLARGRRLRPADLAVLAAFGRTRVRVVRRPRVAILSTGSEVVAVDAVPRPGQVRDMNQVALAAAVARAAGVPDARGRVGDDAEALRTAIAAAAGEADVVLVAGGSSVGVRDLTSDVLVALGARLEFHGVHLRPGRPTLLATLGGTPVLGLPGVPASALIVFAALVAPFLRRLGGETRVVEPRLRGRLAVAVASQPGREDWLRVAFADDGTVTPVAGGNMSVGTLVRADGLLCVPAGVESLAAGAEVEMLPT
jgi:molybdopterin molybdotransferase